MFGLLQERCAVFLELLFEGLKWNPRLEPGSTELREAIQSLSFLVGWLAGQHVPISEALLLVSALKKALTLEQETFYESLLVVVSESYLAAERQKATIRFQDVMEKCQLVCDLHFGVPLLFLVGEPDKQATNEALGRLMMLATIQDAKVVVVDCSHLLHPEDILFKSLASLKEHCEEMVLHCMLSGIYEEMRGQLQKDLPWYMETHETLRGAMEKAAELIGLPLNI